MGVIKKTTNDKHWRGYGGPSWLVVQWGCNLAQSEGVLKQLETELTYNPDIPLLGIFPNKTEMLI